jgi:hypothetical protein
MQPFEGSLSLANVISDSLSKKLSADFIVLEEIPLPPNSFYKPRRRYLQRPFGFFKDRKQRLHKKLLELLTGIFQFQYKMPGIGV